MKEVSQNRIDAALQRILAVAEAPRALAIRPDDRDVLRQAVHRTHAQLLGQADAVLTIALAGCTGAGKSTLINALAGGRIADVSDRRPCTTQTRVFHHRQVASGGLPEDLAAEATFVAHDRPELRQKVIVDTPDLDTFYTRHRAATRAMLKAAGLVIYVFSPERYAEERAWSVIREEQRFSSCLAVLNKSDTVDTDALQRIAGEIRERFAEMGKPDIQVLCITAANHVPDATGQLPAGNAKRLDEFLTLRAYIEHELQSGDIARMIRQQRSRVVDHLGAQIDRLIPAAVDDSLDALQAEARDRAGRTADDLAAHMQDHLVALEADLYPLIVVRKHQRFWGPFRTWLSVADFLRYGLPRLVRQLRVLTIPGEQSFSGRLLPAEQADLASDRLRQQGRDLQTFCFEKGLPVERWRAITGEVEGSRTLTAVAREIEQQFEALAATAYRRGAVFPWLVSFIAWLMPAALIVLGVYMLTRQLIEGRPAPVDLLWDLLALMILAYLLLHIIVSATSSGRGLLPRKSISARALEDHLQRMMAGWVDSYRGDLQADIAGLREPLAVLRDAAEGTIVRAGLGATKAKQAPGAVVSEQAAASDEADAAREQAQPQEEVAAPPSAAAPDEAEPSPEQETPRKPATGRQLSAAELLRRSMLAPPEDESKNE